MIGHAKAAGFPAAKRVLNHMTPTSPPPIEAGAFAYTSNCQSLCEKVGRKRRLSRPFSAPFPADTARRRKLRDKTKISPHCSIYASHGRVPYKRVPHVRVPYGRVSHKHVS